MTSTAEKWFVPDDKYKLSNQDYVFCRACAKLVQNVVERFNDMEIPVPYVTHDTFSQKLTLAAAFFHTEDAGGSLIFADVHEDEKLWQKILEDRAKEPLLDEPSDDHKKYVQEFIEHLRESSEADPESAGGPSDKELHKMAIDRSCYGALDPEYVGYLLEKRRVPIKAQHPFAQSWFVKESENAFYLSQTPEEFAASDLFVAEAISKPKQSSDILMAAYLVGIWVEHHAETLSISKEGVENLLASMDMIKRDQAGNLLPEEKIQPPNPDIVYEFADMRRKLQQKEDHLRSLAARAKKEGRTVAAENMAKFFEMSVKALKEMTENPDVPLKM